VKLIAPKVADWMGEEKTQETTFSNFKEFGGVKRCTKTETKRDGEKFMSVEISEYKTADKLDLKLFESPK
jgi:hypothetical protein